MINKSQFKTLPVLMTFQENGSVLAIPLLLLKKNNLRKPTTPKLPKKCIRFWSSLRSSRKRLSAPGSSDSCLCVTSIEEPSCCCPAVRGYMLPCLPAQSGKWLSSVVYSGFARVENMVLEAEKPVTHLECYKSVFVREELNPSCQNTFHCE